MVTVMMAKNNGCRGLMNLALEEKKLSQGQQERGWASARMLILVGYRRSRQDLAPPGS